MEKSTIRSFLSYLGAVIFLTGVGMAIGELKVATGFHPSILIKSSIVFLVIGSITMFKTR